VKLPARAFFFDRYGYYYQTYLCYAWSIDTIALQFPVPCVMRHCYYYYY
jgi:hypothetical protein